MTKADIVREIATQTGLEKQQIFFHLDYTIGFGISPNHANACGLYHRSGFSPCPEDTFILNQYARFYK